MDTSPIRRHSVVYAALSLIVVGCQSEAPSEPAEPGVVQPVEGAQPAPVSALALASARVLSRGERGRARMLLARAATLAQGMGREAALRIQLAQLAPQLGLSDSVLRDAVVEASHALPTGGSIVQLTQRARGLPVFSARASVTLDARHQLVSVASQLTPASPQAAPQQFLLSPAAALAQLYRMRSGSPLAAAQVRALEAEEAEEAEAAVAPVAPVATGPERYALATPDGAPVALEATLERVYYPQQSALIPAYHVELLLRGRRGGNRAFGAVLDARDARGAGEAALLWSGELTAREAFTYRVWAEPDADHIPTDGPLVDVTPYPGAAPDRKRPEFRAPISVTIEGFNHNPSGSADPWLSADATQTFGNNVSAYTDRDAYTNAFGFPRRDGYDSGDVTATLTSSRTFDYVYDTSRAPDASDTQLKAAVTQVFYVTNWLHDYFYDSGFDEAAGNAQQDNYGRGGVGGDPLHAEAQDSADSGAANNANMSVLSDGTSPRMQMYVWSGLPVRSLVTQPPISFEDELGAASYGPQTFDESGELALVDDGSEAVTADSGSKAGSVTDGCQAFSSVSGRIAVVERGGCTFVDKVQNAQRAGAKALLILDNAPGHSAVNPAIEDPPSVSIPVLVLSYEDGQTLKASLQAGSQSPVQAARFYRGEETMRDGTIDNTVVAHEWGHYLHHRLVNCASASCGGMSEGWADFIALMMVIRDGDSFDHQVFPLSQYACGGLNQSSAYFGTRRAPYSTDLDKDPFTFRHVREDSQLPSGVPLAPTAAEMNEVHNVGEIWAALLFEAYVNVLQAGKAAGRTFAQSKRRMADYVVAGMKAAPIEPTFVEQRDAILAAVRAMARDDASRQADFDAIVRGFAKRGLGMGAVAPPTNSTTLNEAVESFSADIPLSLAADPPGEGD